MSTVNVNDNAVWWVSGLEVDADGAPNAYGPAGGLDYLANAGKPGDWFGIVTDSQGNPVMQGSQDPCPGMYIPQTALVDHSKAVTDPHRYVDSTRIAYVSIPKNATADFGIHIGDVALVHCAKTGQASAAVVADVGPAHKYGEGSIMLAHALGLPNSPKNGGIDSGVTMIVFKGSSKGWPRTNTDIAQQVNDLVNSTGGFEQYGIA